MDFIDTLSMEREPTPSLLSVFYIIIAEERYQQLLFLYNILMSACPTNARILPRKEIRCTVTKKSKSHTSNPVPEKPPQHYCVPGQAH